jgi:hypothetical protein
MKQSEHLFHSFDIEAQHQTFKIIRIKYNNRRLKYHQTGTFADDFELLAIQFLEQLLFKR